MMFLSFIFPIMNHTKYQCTSTTTRTKNIFFLYSNQTFFCTFLNEQDDDNVLIHLMKRNWSTVGNGGGGGGGFVFLPTMIVVVFVFFICLFVVQLWHLHRRRRFIFKKKQQKLKKNNVCFRQSFTSNKSIDNDDEDENDDDISNQSILTTTTTTTTKILRENYNNFDDDHHHQVQQNVIIMKRKCDFLQRVTRKDDDDYGYRNTKIGFIDTWREKEFPNLIKPIIVVSFVNNPTTTTNSNLYPKKQGTESNNGRTVLVDDTMVDNTNHEVDDDENDNEKEVYLDYAGSALPSQSQLHHIYHNQCNKRNQILGNLHSYHGGPASSRTIRMIEKIKKQILTHFRAHPGKKSHYYSSSAHSRNNNNNNNNNTNNNLNDDDIDNDEEEYHPGYEIIFTSGATDSCRILAEHFPWSSKSIYKYPQALHTSVVGIRSTVMKYGGTFLCYPTISDMFNDSILCSSNNCMNTTNNSNGTKEPKKKKEVLLDTVLSQQSSGFEQKDRMEDHNNQNHHHNHVRSSSCSSTVVNEPKHLLAFPLECNFTGNYFHKAKESIRQLQQQQLQQQQQTYYTFIDIAKAASTKSIHLRQLNPDFACVSFYKLFGEPTGLGCLFVKRTALDILLLSSSSSKATTKPTTTKPNDTNWSTTVDTALPMINHQNYHYFGGGSVDVLLPSIDYMIPRSIPGPVGSLVHGTCHFRGIAALSVGFDELERFGGMEKIRKHTISLTKELVQRLQSLRHDNNQPAIVIYGEWNKFYCGCQCESQSEGECQCNGNVAVDLNVTPGPVVAFNIVRRDGTFVGYNEVSKLANLNCPPIQLRTGCFCNPGACQIELQQSNDDIIQNYELTGHVCGDQIDIIHGKPTGAIRVSFGKESIWEDLDVLVTFIERLFVCYETNEISINPSDDVVTQDKSLNKNAPITTTTTAVLKELYVFPIKSCAAQQVSKWFIHSGSGKLLYDREFALVDSSGTAMRLQTYPRMAYIQPKIDIETNMMTITTPYHDQSLIIKLNEEEKIDHTNHVIKVCGNQCSGIVWGDSMVSDWFSDFLGINCWLARYSSQNGGTYEYLPRRTLVPATTTTILQNPQQDTIDMNTTSSSSATKTTTNTIISSRKHSFSTISFANEQPILLISEQAVENLNDILVQSHKDNNTNPPPNNKVVHVDDAAVMVHSRQFRPNMVVRHQNHYAFSTSLPIHHRHHIEDSWKKIEFISSTLTSCHNDNTNDTNTNSETTTTQTTDTTILSLQFDVVGPCARCSMVDLDPTTGLKNSKTLRALAEYRRQNGQITFGIFLRSSSEQQQQHQLEKEQDSNPASSVLVHDEKEWYHWIQEGDTLRCTS